VVSTVRASPTNGTQPTVTATAAVAVTVTDCPPAAAAPPSLAQQLVTGGPLTPIASRLRAGSGGQGGGSGSGGGGNSSSAARGSPSPASTGDRALDMLLAPPDPAGAAASAAPALKLPLLAAAVGSVAPSRAQLWSVRASPVPPRLSFAYAGSADARFTVVYARAPAAAAGRVAVAGRVAISNPNLIDALPLARVQVELYRPGAGAPGAAALATCPRGRDGLLAVDSQLTGSGALECGFVLDAAEADAGPGALLTAVALTADGREAAAPPLRLPAARAPAAAAAPPPGECAAVADDFVLLGEDGSRLLPEPPPPAASGAERLPGERGGGGPGDVICDTRTITYAATFGPLAPGACGTYTVGAGGLGRGSEVGGGGWRGGGQAVAQQNFLPGRLRGRPLHPPSCPCPSPPRQATNLARANPTTGPQRTASALADVTLTVSGCPGAVVRAEVLDARLERQTGAAWGAAAFADASAVTLHWSRAARVEFSASYAPAPAPAATLLVGAVRVQNLGTAAAPISSVQVEVTPDGGAPASVAAECPMGPYAWLPPGVSVTCRFAAPYAAGRGGAVVARALLGGAGERASAPRAFEFDFARGPPRTDTGGCAAAADGFAPPGGGALAPNATSRPAEAAAPAVICNGHSVSFAATLGPFTSASCGTYTVRGGGWGWVGGWVGWGHLGVGVWPAWRGRRCAHFGAPLEGRNPLSSAPPPRTSAHA
jgi:hypothetical protein